MDAKILAEVVATLSAKVLTPEHAHMLKPWEMVFGGLVLPMLAEADESVKASPKFADLTTRYSKVEVEKFFSVREVVRERIVEKQVEVKVEVDRIKIVNMGGGSGERAPTLHGTVEAGGKFRRLKGKVEKISRKENDIPPEGRDAINTWWNANQKLADNGDCQPIADAINRVSGIKPLSAAQVAGWMSWLCRLALMPRDEQITKVKSAKDKGTFSVAPEFSDKFVTSIANNKAKQAADRELALAAKRKMAAEAAAKLEALPTSAAGVQAAQAQPQVTA